MLPVIPEQLHCGWVAHWQEMIADPAMRIGRPRQLYIGPAQRDFVVMEKR